MNKETVVAVLNITKRNTVKDIEIPLYITANELVVAFEN